MNAFLSNSYVITQLQHYLCIWFSEEKYIFASEMLASCHISTIFICMLRDSFHIPAKMTQGEVEVEDKKYVND